jgi:hypothetical protein
MSGSVFGTSLAPGLGPLGGESLRPDRAGAGGRGNFHVHSTFPPACGGKGEVET